MTKTSIALACALFSTLASAQDLAAYPQVFTGPQGLEVVLAPTTDGKTALMRVSGVNHAIDKVVFLGKQEQRGSGTEAYVTTLDGRDWGLVQKQANRYGGGERYVTYLPGRQGAVDLAFDEKKSKALNTAELKTAYTRQNKDGVQEKLARFDRDKHLASAQTDLSNTDTSASSACGSPVKTVVDWKSIDDDKLKKLSIASFCGEVASQMGSMCSSNAGFKAKAASLGQIQCQFGPEIKLRVEGQKLVFTTHQDAPNQGDFVQQFLRNQ